MRHVTGEAPLFGLVYALVQQHFTGMTAQAIMVSRLYMMMRAMTLVAIHPGHWHLLRERGLG